MYKTVIVMIIMGDDGKDVFMQSTIDAAYAIKWQQYMEYEWGIVAWLEYV